MLLLLVAVLISIGAPVGAAYLADPKKNILTQTRTDADQGVQRAVEVVEKVVLNQAAGHPSLENLPDWVKHLLLKVLQSLLNWLHSKD